MIRDISQYSVFGWLEYIVAASVERGVERPPMELEHCVVGHRTVNRPDDATKPKEIKKLMHGSIVRSRS